MAVTSPLMRYHGGKFRLAPWIISHFPSPADYDTYVEPFGGAAGVLLQKPRSYAEVYNDLDGEIAGLFSVLRDEEQCGRLIELLALTPYSRDEFNEAYVPSSDPVESARRVLVRAQMGFGSAGACGGTSGFRTDTQRAYATAMHLWSRFPPVIAKVADRLAGVLIENRPAVDVMQAHDTERTLHYIDPPYLMGTRVEGNRYYRHEMTDDQHAELLNAATQLHGFAVVSGYPSELYSCALKGWSMVSTSSRISAGRGTATRQECLWLSPRVVESQLQQDMFA